MLKRLTPALMPFVLVGLCAAAPSDPVEISQDGRTVISAKRAPGTAPGNGNGSGTGDGGIAGDPAPGEVPYPETPDWQNTLRRQVSSIALGDLTNNGWLDLAAGVYQSNSFPPYESYRDMIYFNTGGVLESEPSWVAADQIHTGDVRIVDINMNGYLDLLVGRGGVAMSPSAIYWGAPGMGGPPTSPGWLSAEPTGAWTSNFLPVDLTNNGWLEIVTANQGNNQFDPYRPMYQFANVNGVVPNAPVWSSTEWSLQSRLSAADWNGNGWLDIAVSKWANFETAIYRNVNGTLEVNPAWTIGATTTDKGVVWMDANLDGWHDLVVGRGISGSSPAELYTNDGGDLTKTWNNEGNYFGHEDIATFDVNADGWPDLITVHGSARRVNIYINGEGELPAKPDWTWQNPLFSLATSVAFGDINGNGYNDMAVGTTGDISLHVFHAIPPQTPPCPADLTGDGNVGVADLLEMLAQWGPCASGPGSCPADLTGDGSVGVADLLALLSDWGTCP